MRSFGPGMMLVLLLPATAAAETFHTGIAPRVDDPAKQVTAEKLEALVRAQAGAALDACWKQEGAMTVSLTFERGKVAKAEVSSGANKAAAPCVLAALKRVVIAGSQGAIGASMELSPVLVQPAPEAKKPEAKKPEAKKPGAAKPDPAKKPEDGEAGIFGNMSRQQIDQILAQNPPTSFGKFTGISGDPRSGGSGTGTGTGAGLTGTGTKGGAAAPPPPPPVVDISIAPTGALNDHVADEIHRVLRARAGIWRACYQRELSRAPGIAGRLVVTFEISPDGNVVRVEVDPVATNLPSKGVIDCVTHNVMRLRFPARPSAATVIFPFQFSLPPAPTPPAPAKPTPTPAPAKQP